MNQLITVFVHVKYLTLSALAVTVGVFVLFIVGELIGMVRQ